MRRPPQNALFIGSRSFDYPPGWVMRMTDGTAPLVDIDYAAGGYWFNEVAYPSHAAFLTAIGGTFARASTATYFDSDGVLQTAASGEFRLDHNSATGAALGALLEGARTNYCLWNRDLTNAAWSPTDMTAAKTATGVDGVANSASTLTADAGNATLLQTLTRGSAARVTGCRVKRRTGSGQVEMTQDNGATWTAVTVTADWTRVSIPAATLANPILGFRIVTSGDEIDVDFVQHEEATFLSSDIATTTVSVARAADSLIIGPTGGVPFTGWNAVAGSFVCVYSVPFVNGALEQVACSFTNNTLSNFFASFIDASGNLDLQNNSGGGPNMDVTFGAASADTTYKTAFAMASNDGAGTINAATVQTDATCALNAALDRLHIGFLITGTRLDLFGHVARFAYFPFRIPNADLTRLSA